MTEVVDFSPGIQIIECGGLGPQNNVYLLKTDQGLVMVDTSWHRHFSDVLFGLEALGWKPEDLWMILITHAHPDHYGAAALLKEKTGAIVAAHEADAPLIEGRSWLKGYPRPVLTLLVRVMSQARGVEYPDDQDIWWPLPVKVDRRLVDGDIIGGWQVVHAPGHTAGNISLYSPTKKVLIAGNWLSAASVSMGEPGLGVKLTQGMIKPLVNKFMDPEQTERSSRKLAKMDVDTLLLSHFSLDSFPAILKGIRQQYTPPHFS